VVPTSRASKFAASFAFFSLVEFNINIGLHWLFVVVPRVGTVLSLLVLYSYYCSICCVVVVVVVVVLLSLAVF
jgi:hypothetical protein